MKCITDLSNAGFKVTGIVTDNHSTNARSFKILLNNNNGDNKHYFIIPGSCDKTFIFFDTVHLFKNINLLSASKFVFACRLEFEVCEQRLSSAPGYICWLVLHTIYDKDKILEANLRMAPKLTRVLHPSNDKRNVDLTIALFHETTIENYIPERFDASEFLKNVFVLVEDIKYKTKLHSQ